ncbi:MAG: glycosyltransferase [Proteobacteria bacterium]|nr:glycosyltransferase [Pseudomonadota bacterium]
MEEVITSAASKITERPYVHGRFLFLGEQKFFIKGVTYGPFPPNMADEPLPEPSQVAHDFQMMAAAGINTVRIYYVPPRWFLDLAARHGVYVLIGIPWPQHICFLDQWEVKENIKQTMRMAVRACTGHPAVLAYLVGNEIPSHIVRWHGAKKTEQFLKMLVDIVHEEDASALATYANYPSTEYLQLDFLDFYSINVYLQEEQSFRSYVKRLHNVAGTLPLVLSEFGLDSMRNGQDKQAQTLEWQIRAAYELGVSGSFVFAWTDEWYTGGHLIDDWAFGIVDAQRNPKSALDVVTRAYKQNIPDLAFPQPMISVLVCAYNAQLTMEGCLASFLQVRYPNFEVIIVNDGSKDTTGEISDRYARLYPDIFRVIHQPNLGLSVARNTGMSAAKGNIIAYTDSDCCVDPHWLHYMALAFRDGRFAAVGGPNLAPAEDNRVAACVSVSPGAPTHVLVTDEIAEHIPGCNMAFRRDAMLAIGGFDATYRAAGDDVDFCWRIEKTGGKIGFCAPMFVWHHRRNTVKAYLKQQMGYGRAEALLAPKHPERFNVLGNSRWSGRIYGDISSYILGARPVVYHGTFGYGLFQTLYGARASVANYLPLSFEWIMTGALFAVFGFAMPLLGLAGAGMLAATLAWCINCAAHATLPEQYDDWRSRALITLLTFLQPVLRGLTRYRTLLELAATSKKVRQRHKLTTRNWLRGCGPGTVCSDTWQLIKNGFSLQHFFWNHDGLEREDVLGKLMEMMNLLNIKPKIDSGYTSNTSAPPWDMQVKTGFWSLVQVRITVEHHGGKKRFVRLAGSVLPSKSGTIFYVAATALTVCSLLVGAHMVAIALLCTLAGFIGLVGFDHFRAAAIVSIIAQRFMENHAAAAEFLTDPADAGVAAQVQPELEGTV